MTTERNILKLAKEEHLRAELTMELSVHEHWFKRFAGEIAEDPLSELSWGSLGQAIERRAKVLVIKSLLTLIEGKGEMSVDTFVDKALLEMSSSVLVQPSPDAVSRLRTAEWLGIAKGQALHLWFFSAAQRQDGEYLDEVARTAQETSWGMADLRAAADFAEAKQKRAKKKG